VTAPQPEPTSRLRRLLGSPRNISMASWLAVAVLVVTITSLVITSILSLTYGADLASNLYEGQLSARTSVKAEEVSRYIRAMRNQTAAIAAGEGTIETVSLFSTAYQELASTTDSTADGSEDVLADFYRDEFAPALEEALGVSVGWRSLVPTTDAGVYLQRHYVAEIDEGNEGLIDDAGDGSAWSEVHREAHLGLYELALRLGAADLYLIEPDNGTIIYSVSKRPDFATSLDFGPHSGTTLATVMRTVRDSPERGVVTLIDMASYAPDVGAPMMFMATPVFDGDRLSGILVVKLASDPIDDIMTSGGNWIDEGFGDTGEVYLTDHDGRMRSVARPFVENPSGFLADLQAAGTATQTEQRAIEGVGTTAIFLKASDSRELVAAASSDDATGTTTDYLLRPVVSATEQIDLGDFSWFAVSQVVEEEVGGPIADFRQALLVAVAIFVIGITFGTVSWARSVFRPVRGISDRLRHAQNDEPVPEPEDMEGAPADFTNLSDNIDEMLTALSVRQSALESASQERVETVRNLLPPAIAERVESGDRDVIDRIPQGGIVVLVTEGLGELVGAQQIGRTQEVLETLIAEIDGAAAHHGLERVKLVGDAYYAGCGLSQPYLDHVPRSVNFALDVRDIVDELNARHGTPLRAGIGVHTGPVTVGLTGSVKLVYDLWGETVRVAHFLARRARPGEILVTDEIRRLLPSDIAISRQSDDELGGPVFRVLGMQVAETVTDE